MHRSPKPSPGGSVFPFPLQLTPPSRATHSRVPTASNWAYPIQVRFPLPKMRTVSGPVRQRGRDCDTPTHPARPSPLRPLPPPLNRGSPFGNPTQHSCSRVDQQWRTSSTLRVTVGMLLDVGSISARTGHFILRMGSSLVHTPIN